MLCNDVRRQTDAGRPRHRQLVLAVVALVVVLCESLRRRESAKVVIQSTATSVADETSAVYGYLPYVRDVS